LSLAALLAVVAPSAARADIPPPERAACDGKPSGAACEFQARPGTCQDSTCSRADPGTGQSTSYACRLCKTVAGDGGAGGEKPDDSGCSMGRAPRALGPWALAGGFALVVLRARRRRR
jgi:hypothetical protein